MLKIVILFIVVVSRVWAQFVCPDMFGMFRHPANCSIFFVCNYGMAHERACPPSLHFDTGLGICRHSSDVRCLHQTQLLTAGFECSSSVGLFADAFSCEHFYLCANGHPYRQKCPSGLIFDGAVCNWKYDRSCLLQERLLLVGPIKNEINGRPKDPKRPSRIDIQKKPKSSMQRTTYSSVLHSTQNEITTSVNDSTTDEQKGDNRWRAKITTVTPVRSAIVPIESQHDLVSTLENSKGDNFTEPQGSPKETTHNLQQTENVTQHQLQRQPPKFQNRWKELRRHQMQIRQQQWMMQRQRQWRLHQQWKLQHHRRLQQEHQKLHERKQKPKGQEQEMDFVDSGLNETAISTRLMAGKVTIKPSLVSSETISNTNISRKWWRTSWTERSLRSGSEKKVTTPPWLFPIRQNTKSPALISIQAFGFKKSLNDSKVKSNNTINTNFTNFDKNVMNKNDNYGNVENRSHSTNIENNTNINTDIDYINNKYNTSKHDSISKIYDNSQVINSKTTNTSSTNSNNINSSYDEYNLNVTINTDIISYNDTNVNITTSSFTNDTNTIILSSTNGSDINFRNNTISQKLNANSTDAMFVLRTSINPNKKSDFSKPSTEKETKKKLTAHNFVAS